MCSLRTTQLFINLKENAFLDKMKFATLAECVKGCDVIDKFEMKYSEKVCVCVCVVAVLVVQLCLDTHTHTPLDSEDHVGGKFLA
jgi:cyclophilin family peptidyl-prolyl cis-trans isomerase